MGRLPNSRRPRSQGFPAVISLTQPMTNMCFRPIAPNGVALQQTWSLVSLVGTPAIRRELGKRLFLADFGLSQCDMVVQSSERPDPTRRRHSYFSTRMSGLESHSGPPQIRSRRQRTGRPRISKRRKIAKHRTALTEAGSATSENCCSEKANEAKRSTWRLTIAFCCSLSGTSQTRHASTRTLIELSLSPWASPLPPCGNRLCRRAPSYSRP